MGPNERNNQGDYFTRIKLASLFYPGNIIQVSVSHLENLAMNSARQYIAFEGTRRIAGGPLGDVASKTKVAVDRRSHEPILIFDDQTSEPIEIDFRGTVKDVLNRLNPRPSLPTEAKPLDVEVETQESRVRGRPKLGVVAREVTLLPRHWEWLNNQKGGASVALRKLVEEARRSNEDKDQIRRAQDAAYRFMSTMAGNLPGFEEAVRTLYANDFARFEDRVARWPADIRVHSVRLAQRCIPAKAK